MLYSKSYIFTLREDPKDAEIISHKLMLRAGFIRKSAVGLYTWMPLGKRILDKVIQIVKEEMDKSGSLDTLPSFVIPGEFWKETDRWNLMGKEMLRLKDRHDRDYVLGPTHEESYTEIIRGTARSYQDLPVILYQINTKFRDEIRPRYGLIRCREFIMKDSYSYDLDEDGLDISYQLMRKTYLQIFKRLSLNVDVVLADSGNMGGSGSEEFVVPSEVGEETIVRCSCGYVANVEKADSIIPQYLQKKEATLEKVFTPNAKKIEDLVHFLSKDEQDMIKVFLVEADGRFVMACIRADLQINESKLKNLLGATEMEMADADKVVKELNLVPGFLGPKDINIEIVADESIIGMQDAVMGANEKDMHYCGVSVARDLNIKNFAVFHEAESTHKCVNCQQLLNVYKGIEVGHIFKLGRKYTESMGVRVLNRNNQEIIPTCGSYGIGIGRTIAALIEQGSDNQGVVLPMAVAPYHVIIIPAFSEGELYDKAYEIYNSLLNKNIEVMFDDRNERIGVKFKDADLIGIPIRVTIGKSWEQNKKVEIKLRESREIEYLTEDLLLNHIITIINTKNTKF